MIRTGRFCACAARNRAQNRRDDACGGGEHVAACQHARSSQPAGKLPLSFETTNQAARAHSCRFVRGAMIAGYRNSGAASTTVGQPRGALEALKCGDDRSGALEMRRVDSGIGAATSAAIGAVALDGLATRPWRPKPCCPDVATANHSIGCRTLCSAKRGRSGNLPQRWQDASPKRLRLKERATGGRTEQAYKHRARNAGELAFRGDYLPVDFLPVPSTGPWGARRPGVPRALGALANCSFRRMG